MTLIAFDQMDTLQAMKRRMNYLVERQGVIAENIAHANVPRYRAQDISPPSFQALMENAHGKLALSTTSDMHKSGTMMRVPSFFAKDDPTATEQTPMGNNVVLEDQAMKMAETSQSYQETTRLYRKMTGLIRIAVDARG